MVEVKTVKSTEAPNVTIPIKWIDSQNVERLWTASGWVLSNEGGGGGEPITIEQTIGVSETSVMSQNAVTNELNGLTQRSHELQGLCQNLESQYKDLYNQLWEDIVPRLEDLERRVIDLENR